MKCKVTIIFIEIRNFIVCKKHEVQLLVNIVVCTMQQKQMSSTIFVCGK